MRFTACVSFMLHVHLFPVFGIFLFQCYNPTCRPAIGILTVWAVFCVSLWMKTLLEIVILTGLFLEMGNIMIVLGKQHFRGQGPRPQQHGQSTCMCVCMCAQTQT